MADLSPWRKYIDDALAQGWGGHTFEDVERAVVEKDMQVWTRPDAAIITQVVLYPQFKQLYFFLAGGNLATLEGMLPEIYDWARSIGCTKALFAGRPGWQRTFLTRHGWQVKPITIMEKSL